MEKQLSTIGLKTADTFHLRRKQTNYLCGFADFEDEVCQIIKENNSTTKVLLDKVAELQRDIITHKQQVDLVTRTRDVGFQNEVKSILDH